ELPRNVIARADVNVFVGQTFVHDRLDSFGLGRFLRVRPGLAEHVQKIGVAAGVELIGALDFHAAFPEKIDNRAMKHSRAQLRFDVVADVRQIFVSDPVWAKRFADKNLPIIGDDIKSQMGATVLHRTIVDLFRRRGVRVVRTYQLNTGGNTDFLNMLNRTRLTSKKKIGRASWRERVE